MNRCFLFLIGGTGARVAQSLIHLIAAACGYEVLKNWEIVPILLDLDARNGNLKACTETLELYQKLQKQVYHEDTLLKNEFFKVKVSQLSEVAPNAGNPSFHLPLDFANESLEQIVNYGELETTLSGDGQTSLKPTQELLELLFTKDDRKMTLEKGFKGHPGIGTLVFESLTNTDDDATQVFSNAGLNAFVQTFNAANDRIFIVNSIFGGTGSSGLPWLLKMLRKSNPQNVGLANAPIGVTSVLPYYNIQADDDSIIDSAGFITRTKAALRFYDQSLKPNVLFLIGEDSPGKIFPNHEGGISQKNEAHPVEFFAATSLIKFLAIPQNDLPSIDAPAYYRYGIELAEDNGKLNLTHFRAGTFSYEKIAPGLTRFFLAAALALKILPLNHNNLWALKAGIIEHKKQKLTGGFYQSMYYKQLISYLTGYWRWLTEMGGVDDNQPSYLAFKPFNLSPRVGEQKVDNQGDNMDRLISGIDLSQQNYDVKGVKKTRLFKTIFYGKQKLRYTLFTEAMNDKAKELASFTHSDAQKRKALLFTELLYQSTYDFVKAQHLFN